MSYSASPTSILRNDTIYGGATGASFASGSYDVSLLDDIFSGQTATCVYFSDDSLQDGPAHTDGSITPGYEGDGNIYNPGGGDVGTIQAASTTTNYYAALDAYAEFWYVLQYTTTSGGNPITQFDQTNGDVGERSDGRSLQEAPAFANAAGGDFRLAAAVGNLINTGADRIYLRLQGGGYPTVWDGLGAARVQGDAIDAGAFAAVPPISATFALTTAAATSAGVYDANGNLVRTIWSGVYEPAGNVTVYWNGLNDSGVPANVGEYAIKLLTNDVQYVWDGTMNTSSPDVGVNIVGSLQPIDTMVTIGGTGYYSAYWAEGHYQLYKFNLSNPNQTTGYGVPVQWGGNVITRIATDGTYIYALAEIQNPSFNFTPEIEKFDTSFDLLSTASVSSNYGSSDIAAQDGAQGLVFVAHAADNEVYAFKENALAAAAADDLSGAALGWSDPLSLAVDPVSGDLWLACKNASGNWQVLCYSFSSGAPTLVGPPLTGFADPIGMAVSTDGNRTLMVADGENSGVAVDQQIKAYNSSGTAVWTLGEAGGYATNGPATTTNKFILGGVICPESDGSFWITDFGAGFRLMHFASYANGMGFLDDAAYEVSYSAAADLNNPDHVFQTAGANGNGPIDSSDESDVGQAFVEYSINYSAPFTENQGWTAIDNWTYLGLRNLDATSPSNTYTWPGLTDVATLSNGRTYALLPTCLITGSSADDGDYTIVELTSSGLRNTGVQTSTTTGYNTWLNVDGSLSYSEVSNGTDTFYKETLTGFDANGNPHYAAPTATAAVPWSYTWDAQPPAPGSLAYPGPTYLTMPNGELAVYNQWAENAGMHLGMINPATDSYQWESMPASGTLDGQGNFDTAAWYGGNRVMVDAGPYGSTVFVGYNGEGWETPTAEGRERPTSSWSTAATGCSSASLARRRTASPGRGPMARAATRSAPSSSTSTARPISTSTTNRPAVCTLASDRRKHDSRTGGERDRGDSQRPDGRDRDAGLGDADQPQLDRPQRRPRRRGDRLQRLSRHIARRRKLQFAAQRRHAADDNRVLRRVGQRRHDLLLHR